MSAFRTIEVSDPALAPEGLSFITVKSAALAQRADITLYVPPQAQGLRDLPLVLLLHGVYGSQWAWAFKGGVHHTARGRLPRLRFFLSDQVAASLSPIQRPPMSTP